jgi:hypothetical protein
VKGFVQRKKTEARLDESPSRPGLDAIATSFRLLVTLGDATHSVYRLLNG